MICLDASVAAKLILPETHSELATALYGDVRDEGAPIVAPALLPYEITNILRKRMTRGGLAREDANQALDEFFQLRITLFSSTELHELALNLAEELNLRAAYDAHYVALARLLDCDLWTDDSELIRVAAPGFPRIRAIATYKQNAGPSN